MNELASRPTRPFTRAFDVALTIVLALAAPAAAKPDTQSIVRKMHAGLDPERPSIRKLTFQVSGDGEVSRMVVAEARKKVNGTARILLVVLAPEALRGTAYLVDEGGGKENLQWAYLPSIRRVRTVVSPEAYTAFLNSDFTYADLGFVRPGMRYTGLGEAQHDGTEAYELQGIPKETWYYARTLTWVDAASGLPIDRLFYDPGNRLWKRERFEQVSVVDGVPTILHASMEDLQAKTRTDVEVSAVNYGVDLPDALLEPAGLAGAVASPLWAGLG